MPGTSSLLRSASSTRKKVLAQQDAVAEYEYSLGYKSYEDYREYDRYLENRIKSSSDPGAALSLQKKRNSAFRGYMGNEIQRQSIAVIEGRQSNVDKYNAMYQLYQQAAANGLYDTAQTLYLQLGNLDKTIQNEAISAAGSASASMRAAVTSVKDEIKAQKAVLTDMGRELQANGIDNINKAFEDPAIQQELAAAYPDLAPVFKQGGTIGFWDIANGVAENIKDTYAQAISELPPEETGELREQLAKLNSGETTFQIPGVEGGVTLKDLQTQIAATRAGGSYFFQGPNGVLERGKLTDYTWDKEGNIVPVYANPYSEGTADNPYNQVVDNFDQSQVYRRDEKGNYVDESGKVVAEFKDGQIVAPGGGDFRNEADREKALQAAGQSFETLLKEQGFNTIKKEGKLLVAVTDATMEKFGKVPGLELGDIVEVVRDGQGNLRFTKKDQKTGKEQLYQYAFDPSGKGSIRRLQAGEQGAISAQALGDLNVYAKDLNKDYAGNEGVDRATQSLVSTVSKIGQGVGFKYGVLADAEARRRFLTGDGGGIQNKKGEVVNLKPSTNPALKLNIAERAVKRIVTPIANPGRTVSGVARWATNPIARTLASALRGIIKTAGQNAANNSLAASRQKIQEAQGFKYGVLATQAGRDAFLKSLR